MVLNHFLWLMKNHLEPSSYKFVVGVMRSEIHGKEDFIFIIRNFIDAKPWNTIYPGLCVYLEVGIFLKKSE